MVDVAEVIRHHGSAYRVKYGKKMLPSHHRVMWAIEHCRTEALGGHIYQCSNCDETRYSYHSCRNRHCPKCQNNAGEAWLDRQVNLRLPVPYFMLTFTLPAALREIARCRQALFYNLLFRTAAAAMQQLAQDPRFVGGKIGMVGVLHTWGRNLSYHPHVHFLVPGGGLAADGVTWLPARKNFLLPVKALSRVFRAKFRDALRHEDCFNNIPPSVWTEDWVVHCQPVGDGLGALKYLAPYIFRVAMSNNRILSLENDRVKFRYRDTDTGQERVCSLAVEEFIRRFLQHVLPKGFVKVRYYGLFSPTYNKVLAVIRQRLGGVNEVAAIAEPEATSEGESNALSQTDIQCSACGAVMRRYKSLHPQARCPP